MPTVLITGANRGLGLEFARQYAADGWSVIGTARRPSPELEQTGAEILPLDMTDLASVATVSVHVHRPLDLVIANAGIYGSAKTDVTTGPKWLEVLTVNTVAPTTLALSLLPKLTIGGKIVAISSMMGSIAESGTGSISYRSSKAALNMAWHVLARENPQAIIALLNPGWVKTDMGGAGAAITAGESIGQMRRVIDGLAAEQSGGFFDRDGSIIPW